MNDYIEMVSYDRPMDAYVISDLHGNIDIAKQVIEIADEGNTVFFLGDANDRDENGWEVIKMFLKHPNIIYILGNHEDMLVKAMRPYFFDHDDFNFQYSYKFEVWMWNQGYSTFESIMAEDYDKARMYWNELRHLPKRVKYINDEEKVIYMCHSGWEFFVRDKYHDLKYDEKLLWDRTHYFEDKWFGAENEFMIHGHTSVPHMLEDLGGDYHNWDRHSALWYCHTHKIDIDMRTIETKRACMINLNTFEETILEDRTNGEL